MTSLDFEAEKTAFRDYFNDNARRFEQAKDVYLTLLRSLLAHGNRDVAHATGRIKEREDFEFAFHGYFVRLNFPVKRWFITRVVM